MKEIVPMTFGLLSKDKRDTEDVLLKIQAKGMSFHYDNSFALDQAGLEISLNDFTFDSTQQQLQQQHQQHNQHQELQDLLLQDDHSNNAQPKGTTGNMSSTETYDFHSSALSSDMMVTASASTTPIFPTNPDKINLVNTSLQQQLHHQQVMLQQQPQQQQHFQTPHHQVQQQHQLQQQQQQQQSQSIPTSQHDQLLTPTDFTQYMSPLVVQPDTSSDAAMVITDQFDDDEMFFTPLISPAMTPSHSYSNLTHALSTANEIFSPLTSPALQPLRSSIDYLSFPGQSFSPLPTQFHQSQVQQQQLQLQLHQLQPQPQPELIQTNQPPQQQLQQQIQTPQGSTSNQARVDARSPALNSQRPSVKRRATGERASNGPSSTTPRSGPVRGSLPMSSPAMRPLSNPMSPATLRKQQASQRRPSSITPASPLTMHFPPSRPSPSPLLISTSQPPLSQAAQASPSPRLVTNMHQLSMIPSSPMGFVNTNNDSQSPALFALPASSMMPPPSSPMILPSASQINNTPRQRSLMQPQQPIQMQSQHQLSIHQPISTNQPSPAIQPKSDNSPSLESKPDNGDTANTTHAGNSSVLVSETSKSAIAPVTPASLMNLGSGSGTESTPASSPKFGAHSKPKPTSQSPSQAPSSGDAAAKVASAVLPSPAGSSSSSSSSQKRGIKRQANGDISIGSGTMAPSTPRQLALTPGATATSPMPPPPSGFTLISPALKPTLMQQHRGSQSMLVSPRLQPQLVSPSLKPWLPGVSTTEAMARLASKSNYQNILDGDHTALGLSYNTDLHSGIELRRTSHKAAEQKRRDSLKHCFDDLRQMIPNIQEKSPSKVFLLKKSFDYICNLKSEVAKRDLEMARLKAQHEFMKTAMESWMATLPEDSPFKKNSDGASLVDSWAMPEEEVKKATTKEEEAAKRAAEMTELSAAAVEAARTQPGGQNKGGKESQADVEDSDDEGPAMPKTKKPTSKPNPPSSTKRGNSGKKASKNGGLSGTAATSVDDATTQPTTSNPLDKTKLGSKSSDGGDEEEEDDEEDELEDQEMADATLIALSAEIAKHEERFQRAKGSGRIKVPKSVKKPTVWQRQNPGIAARAKRNDMTLTSEDPEGDTARKVAMERKAKMYEMLKRGEDVPDRLRDELLVEFEYKNRGRRHDTDESDSDDMEAGKKSRRRSRSNEGFRGRRRDWSDDSRSRSRSRSSEWDRDESAALARDPKDFTSDPWVEHVDEFGRTRLMRQSEIPKTQPVREERGAPGIHDPANPFPVFRNQDAIDKQEWIKDATGEMKRSDGGYSLANTVRHYDNTLERRARGVGFYAFSQEEEVREKQMRELRELRQQTELKREQYRSLRDKRRDEIEARKKIIQQKRLKSLASTVTTSHE
ncbi:hypothetical protein BGX20_005470 [Mortierella sp. AD010]|nr:hypothetical protein BGX20_005470 [Mortierella sp. AD010]